ncbi:MAG: PAS domain S-box protein [Chloroflexi bacterium]|nr:PAS domain S-box protein [Chloroflexota bacterium]
MNEKSQSKPRVSSNSISEPESRNHSSTTEQAGQKLPAEWQALRCRAEELSEQLHMERNLLEAIMEHTEAHLAYLDPQFRFVLVNSAYARGSGYTKEQLIGRNHFDLFPHAENQAIFERVRDSGEPVTFTAKPFVFPNHPEWGITYWDWTLTPIQDANGTVQGLVLSLVNVTERVNLLKENQRQREFLEQVLETAPVGIAVVRGSDHRYEMVNSYYQRIPGRASEPMVGRTIAEVFPDVAAQGALEFVDRAYRTGEVVSLREYRASVGPNREETYWNVDHVPLRDADGRVDGVLIIAHEVTEEVLARRHAEELAARDEAILSAMQEGLVIFDLEGHILAHNPASLRLHGMGDAFESGQSLDEMRALFQVYYLDGRPMPLEEGAIARVLRGQEFSGLEAKLVNLRDGRTWIGSFSGALVRNAEGRPLFGIVTVHDVTAQKEAERQLALLNVTLEQQISARTAELRASELRFRTIYEEAGIGMAIVDAEGRIVAGNRALQHIFGCSEEELHGRFFTDFGHPDDAKEEHALLDMLRSGKQQTFRTERRYIARNGRMGWACITGSILPMAESEPPYVLMMVEDITDRRETQQVLIQAERMNAVSELAASLTHEINNPLQAATGCLQLAAEMLPADAEALRYLDVAVEELHRAARLVRQLRNLSKPDRRQERQPTDLGDLVRQVVELNHYECQNRGIEIAVDVGPLPPLRVVSDEIRQVLLNLLRNAIDAMPQGGMLRISATSTTNPPGVKLAIADTGIGIPAEALPRIFDLFYSTKEEGLGMGLYISRQIVQQHGGYIDVESEPGQGTTFRLWFPSA